MSLEVGNPEAKESDDPSAVGSLNLAFALSAGYLGWDRR